MQSNVAGEHHAAEGPVYAKGHGTENDFVVLADPEGALSLTDERVRALCDRRRGLGADGVLRVVRTGALADAPAGIDADTWFMDYRNADGSIAEMCGNGVRVFARYLVESGLAEPGSVQVGTRAGLREVVVHPDGLITVDMGVAAVMGKSSVTVGEHTLSGIAVDLGNPHLACVTDVGVDRLDLSVQPPYDTELFPNGVNVEFVQPIGADPTGVGAVRMRVHERGVGETRSCGTGTVAATVAALHAEGAQTGRKRVDVPGGQVTVEVTESTTTLTGPAVFVARGHLDRRWWDEVRAGERG